MGAHVTNTDTGCHALLMRKAWPKASAAFSKLESCMQQASFIPYYHLTFHFIKLERACK